jgi:hypothetical protein
MGFPFGTSPGAAFCGVIQCEALSVGAGGAAAWLELVASTSTQSAWQDVPKNDTLKNDGTFDGTFF